MSSGGCRGRHTQFVAFLRQNKHINWSELTAVRVGERERESAQATWRIHNMHKWITLFSTLCHDIWYRERDLLPVCTLHRDSRVLSSEIKTTYINFQSKLAKVENLCGLSINALAIDVLHFHFARSVSIPFGIAVGHCCCCRLLLLFGILCKRQLLQIYGQRKLANKFAVSCVCNFLAIFAILRNANENWVQAETRRGAERVRYKLQIFHAFCLHLTLLLEKGALSRRALWAVRGKEGQDGNRVWKGV